MSKNNDKPTFKPYGDVFFDNKKGLYNIFGLEISPQLLYEIANGSLSQSYGAFDLKYYKEDNGYDITILKGLEFKLKRLFEEPIDSDIDNEKELMEYMKKCFKEFAGGTHERK